jgi:hypothetical protein
MIIRLRHIAGDFEQNAMQSRMHSLDRLDDMEAGPTRMRGTWGTCPRPILRAEEKWRPAVASLLHCRYQFWALAHPSFAVLHGRTAVLTLSDGRLAREECRL